MIKHLNFNSVGKYIVMIAMTSALAIGCSKKQPVKEEVSINEILGEKPDSKKLESEEVSMPELDGSFVSEMNQKLYKNYRSSQHQYSTLIDRFSAVSVEKATYWSLKDTLAIANLFMYNFIDTSATFNAFNNWLSCFGNDCEEIILKENKSRVNEEPLWCGVYENSIVIIKFSEKALSFKNELKQTVFQTKGQALKYTLNVTAENQLKWD